MTKDWNSYIEEQVHDFYHYKGINCAIGTLKLMSEIFDTPLADQVYDSAIGMHGAGKYGAQCGLLEGGLMFITIYGKENGIEKADLVKLCYQWAETFEKTMGGIHCKDLRPYPFTPEDAPKHLCEPITVKAVKLLKEFVEQQVQVKFAAK